MKRKLLRLSSVLAAISFTAIFFGLAIYNTPDSTAVKATDFKAGRIIDDAIFYNSNTMSVSQIQSFMDNHLPTCDMWGTGKMGYGYYIKGKAVDPNTTRAEYARRMREEVGDKRYHAPPYVCINKYYENPTTHVTNFDTNGVAKEGMLSAAQILYNAAKENSINPQVLLVMLKKESYAWGDDWPTKNEYNAVMGYACPDSAPCDTKYYGFYNQVNMAAWQLDYYKKNIYSYNYRPYTTNKIYYNPDYSCGSKSVYLENLATTSLYIYTPYVPNDAALRNYPGTSTCGSYGNRNFFMYFSEWFGTTLASFKTTAVANGYYRLLPSNDTSTSLQPVNNTKEDKVQFTTAKKTNTNFDIFEIKKKSNNNYTIVNVDSNKALDTPSGNAIYGKVLQQYTYNNLNPQEWKFYDSDGGTVSIASVISGNLVAGINSDKRLALFPYTKEDGQKYTLETATPSGSSTTSSTTIETNQTIADGKYNITSALTHSYLLDVKGGKSVDGTPIQLYVRNGLQPQVFDITYDNKVGYYKIKSALTDKYVGLRDNKTDDRTVIELSSWKANCGQYWLISKKSNGNYNILSKCSANKALDVKGGKVELSNPAQLYTVNNLKPQEWSFEDVQKKSQIINNGTYSIASVLKSNYMIDVTSGSYTDGRNIQMYSRNNNNAQNFIINFDAAKKLYTIKTSIGSKYLSVTNSSTQNGANVYIWQWTGKCDQYWDIQKTTSGSYNIFNSCSYKPLDISGGKTANKTNVQIWQMNWLKPQEWKLEKK